MSSVALPLQLRFERQGDETAKDVPEDGFIALVVDGPGFQDRSGRTKTLLGGPQHLVDVGSGLRIVPRVGAQDPQPTVARFGFDLGLIDSEFGLIDSELTVVLHFY